MNGSDIDSATGNCLANGAFSLLSSSLSTTAYLLNTDYINIGYYLESGPQSISGTRNTLSITLIQRTA